MAKWIQGADVKEGAFEKWCKREGFGGVCQACINKAARVGGHPAKMALAAVNMSQGKYTYPNITKRKKIAKEL